MRRSQSSNTEHAQKTQSSEHDKTVLSGTEKPVVLQHGESEDPTLIHKPHDEANKALKAEVLQNISRKFDVSSSRVSRMWAKVHFKDEDDIKRIMQHVEVQKNQTIFETVQAPVGNFKFSEKEIHGLHGESTRCLTIESQSNSRYKFLSSVIRSCVMVGNVQIIFKEQERSNQLFSFFFFWKLEVSTISTTSIKKMLEE